MIFLIVALLTVMRFPFTKIDVAFFAFSKLIRRLILGHRYLCVLFSLSSSFSALIACSLPSIAARTNPQSLSLKYRMFCLRIRIAISLPSKHFLSMNFSNRFSGVKPLINGKRTNPVKNMEPIAATEQIIVPSTVMIFLISILCSFKINSINLLSVNLAMTNACAFISSSRIFTKLIIKAREQIP